MSPILDARSVSKIYRSAAGEVPALSGIDFCVEEGDMVAVMGPSGCGKTTLLNCLSGLDEIDNGRVLVHGEDIHRMSDAKRTSSRAKGMGFVFQAFHLIPVFSSVENVEIPLVLAGLPPQEARQRASEMLGRVGLSARLGHRPPLLSGGEQQKVAIARALVAKPAIVWADEPTGNLDSHTADEVLALLLEANSEGQTVVLVTHDPHIGGACRRLVRMRDGKIEEDSG